MPAAKKLLALLVMLLAALPLSVGCAAETDDEDDDAEEEPVGETNSELRSAVSCKETTMKAYRSGSPYSVQVISIGGKPVVKATGHAFLKMQAAAQKAGVALSLTSGFRTMEQQQRLYHCYKTRSCNNGNLAARPGYSNHQNGAALDVSTSSWLARNAGKFGFVRTVSKEAWHYEFRGKDPGGPCSRGTTADPDDDNTAPTGADDDDDDGTPKMKDGITWLAPAQDSTMKNGFTVKARAKTPSIVKVVYSQGSFVFGTATNAANDFALDYTFKYMGDKTLTVKGYDAKGALVALDHVDFTLTP